MGGLFVLHSKATIYLPVVRVTRDLFKKPQLTQGLRAVARKPNAWRQSNTELTSKVWAGKKSRNKQALLAQASKACTSQLCLSDQLCWSGNFLLKNISLLLFISQQVSLTELVHLNDQYLFRNQQRPHVHVQHAISDLQRRRNLKQSEKLLTKNEVIRS